MCALLLTSSILLLGLHGGVSPSPSGERIPVLILSGVNNHDWEWSSPAVHEILERSGRFASEIAYDARAKLADAAGLKRYAAIVLDYNDKERSWGEQGEKNFLAAVRAGTGVVVLHAADNAFPGWVEYEKLVGHLWREGTGHGRFHSFDVDILDRTHPVARALPHIADHPDELYHKLVPMHDPRHCVLARAYSAPDTGGTGEFEPMVTVGSYGEGRVFHCVPGHVWEGGTHIAFEDPQFEQLLARGTEWAATGDVQEVEPNQLSDYEKRQGWQLLFDGKSTEQWRGYRRAEFPAKGWVVEEGALRCKARGGGGDIVTVEQYRDFELVVDFKVSRGANSGIMYRSVESEGQAWYSGVEYQILDDPSYKDVSPLTASGSMYALVKAEHKKLAATGEWNHARILVLGNHVEHWLNGVKVCEAELGSPEWIEIVKKSKFHQWPIFSRAHHGHIVLQDHGHDLWFRSMKIRRLAKRPTASSEAVKLFDGKDLAGWTYFLEGDDAMADVWRVENGMIICRGQPTGYIRTEKDYTSYILELQWRYDPGTKKGGNSGVLLRQTGPDKIWPHSIEAQLKSGSAGDFWNIDNFPMQVAPNRTKGRNTRKTHSNERPIGEWNDYEIYVNGGHIVLKVNGQVLNEAYDALEIPGKICLQSEGAEIHFRNIMLQPLAGER